MRLQCGYFLLVPLGSHPLPAHVFQDFSSHHPYTVAWRYGIWQKINIQYVLKRSSLNKSRKIQAKIPCLNPQNQRSISQSLKTAQFSGPGGPATSGVGVWLGWCFQGYVWREDWISNLKMHWKSCQIKNAEIAWNHEGDRIKVFQNLRELQSVISISQPLGPTQLICQVSSTYHYFSFRKYSRRIPGISFPCFFDMMGKNRPTFHFSQLRPNQPWHRIASQEGLASCSSRDLCQRLSWERRVGQMQPEGKSKQTNKQRHKHQTTITRKRFSMQPEDRWLIWLIWFLMVDHICLGGIVVVLHFLVKCV